MAVGNKNNSPPASDGDDGSGESAPPNNDLSLEQALLAPLNSILKAQLHSARSFLNLLLQIGYPHGDDEGNSEGRRSGEPFHMEFKQYDDEGNVHTLRVPALSLVPIAPLAVDSAEFSLEMAVKKVTAMQQMQATRKDELAKKGEDDPDIRPWFLVDKPVSIEGAIAPPSNAGNAQRNESQSSIKININVKSIPMPSGLDKLLTTLTNMGEVTSKPVDEGTSENDPTPPTPETNQ